MCVLIFCTNLSETFLILKRIQRDIAINVRTSPCKLPVILVGFYLNLNFLYRFSESLKYEISSKSVHRKPSCCTRTDGHDEAVVLRNLANAPKRELKTIKYLNKPNLLSRMW